MRKEEENPTIDHDILDLMKKKEEENMALRKLLGELEKVDKKQKRQKKL